MLTLLVFTWCVVCIAYLLGCLDRISCLRYGCLFMCVCFILLEFFCGVFCFVNVISLYLSVLIVLDAQFLFCRYY